MATRGHHSPPLEVIIALGPAPGEQDDLAGKDCHAGGRLHHWRASMGRLPGVMAGLIVVAYRGAHALGDPVEHHGGQEFVLAKSPFDLPAAIAPGPPLLHNPGAQPHRRVVEAVGERLGLGALQGKVAALLPPEALRLLKPPALFSTIFRWLW